MGKNEKSRRENTKRLALLASTALCLAAQPATGQVVWQANENRAWSNPNNWDTGSIPASTDDVEINLSGFDGPIIGNIEGVSFETRNMVVGTTGEALLLINARELETHGLVTLGQQDGSFGDMRMRTKWTAHDDIIVGDEGIGILVLSDSYGGVSGGLDVEEGKSITIARGSGSEGTFQIGEGGTPGKLNVSTINFGDGTGTLIFNHNATEANSYQFAADLESTGTGNHAIEHLAGVTTYTGDGSDFTGTTTISGGALLITGNLGSSSVTVSGDDGAELQILSGGHLESIGTANIGNSADPSSTILVSGSGSIWTNEGSIWIGRLGAGSVVIEAGGHIDSGNVEVGGLPAPDRSQIAVDDGTWDLGSLYAGLATIEVRNGAVVINDGIARLGNGGNRHTELTISNSEWTTTGQFEIGWESSAEISVVDGGTLETGATVLGDRFDGAWGTLTISDLGSTWTANGDVIVGNKGKGMLTISNGAEVVAGGNDIHLAHDNGSEGVLNIGAAAGEIEQDAGFLTADSIVFLDGNGTLVFNHTGTETNSYAFDIALESDGAGNHAIEHLAGVTNYTGDGSGFTGTTTISGGTLYVDDALGGSLNVDGGVLGGIGTLSGDVTINSGSTIAPGNSIGTLHVSGNVVFNAGSTYEIEIAAPDQADLISAKGSVTIDGGELAIIALDTGTSYAEGQTYRIIEADDGVIRNAEFLHNQPVSLMRTEVIYGVDVVDLLLSADIPFTSFAQTYNQFQSAAGLQDMEQSGDAVTVYNEVVQLSLQSDGQDAVRRAFDLSSGEVHASGQHVIDQTFGLFNRTLRQQGSAGVGALGSTSVIAPLAYGPVTRPASVGAIDDATANYAESRVANAWLAPLGGRGSIDGDGNAATLDWWSAGIAGGYEGQIDMGTGNAFAGFGLGYIRSHGSVDARLSSFDADGFHIGAYGAWEDGPWRLVGALTYAANRISTERNIVFGGLDRTAEADYWIHSLGFSGEAAYGMDMGGGTTLLPLFTLDAGWSGHGGFTETGADALNLTGASENWTRLDTGVGIGISHVVPTETGRLILEGRAVWEHAFADDVPSQLLSFAGSPTSFTVNGPAANRDRLRLGAGLGWDIAPDMTLRANYEGVFAGSYDSHTASLGLNIRF
ncbi:autotransporter outer membrane beta-barrel domain-containing protein [Pelagibacterium sediminicola]|uniref:autotransporter family protein n=1 Tax=Pelagibacterium sediminicola TaxID=2248761 RepID=UPI000E31A085|nr:autotransporter outer membrane beta-barrel domain-containing protein [Pelagibacterium sediminicola]